MKYSNRKKQQKKQHVQTKFQPNAKAQPQNVNDFINQLMSDISILLYIPNLIGYFRFLLLIVSWHYAMTHPFVYLYCYSFSMLLDALDGMAAVRYNQMSMFGA